MKNIGASASFYKAKLTAEIDKKFFRLASLVDLPDEMIIEVQKRTGLNDDEFERKYMEEYEDIGQAKDTLDGAKIIAFSSEQMTALIRGGNNHNNGERFIAPFEKLMIVFDSPVALKRNGDGIKAILIKQGVVLDATVHRVAIVFTTNNVATLNWHNEIPSEWHNEIPSGLPPDVDPVVFANWLEVRGNIIACVEFINCENVYLHKEDGAPAAVNRKRAAKGKATIEPYYTCRIRGVNYDNPVGIGKGTSPGHIFDVRGHFRRLDSGKVTWVRPHLRGLKSGGEYVPKVYAVDSR